jgi:hypothetical protein
MFLAALRKCSFIAKFNLRYHFLVHFAASLLLLCLAAVIFGISNLDAAASAIPLEMFVTFIGIVLLTPVFMPEEPQEIRELIESKHTAQTAIHSVRLVYSSVIMLVMSAGFACMMNFNGSSFPLLKYIAGTFSGAFSLGLLGYSSLASLITLRSVT